MRGHVARVAGPLLLSLASLAAGLLVAEGLFTLLLVRPGLLRHLPANLQHHLRRYYLEFDRELIQASAHSARYDPELFYTLRPGTFRFVGREFDVEFHVNHLGLRDDEADLAAPDVVVLGDSYAMGWGVAASETLAARVQAASGLKVLNAAVSSYGTAREVKLLERLDLSRARALVIQYGANDAWENASLRRHGGRLPIRSRDAFEHNLRRTAQRRRYVFGKRTFEIVRGVLGRPDPHNPPLPSPEEQARLFVGALLSAREHLEGRVLVVFEINPLQQMTGAFAHALRREIHQPGHPLFVQGMQVLDLSEVLEAGHYFHLDDHLRAGGHAAVAREVVAALARADLLGAAR